MDEAQALIHLAAEGHSIEDWKALKNALLSRFDEAVALFEKAEDFYDPITATYSTIPELCHQFTVALRQLDVAPCSVQRLAELLERPNEQYKVSEKTKYILALMKSVRVSPSDALPLAQGVDYDKLLSDARDINVKLEDIEWAAVMPGPDFRPNNMESPGTK